jgi:hypothetical protein
MTKRMEVNSVDSSADPSYKQLEILDWIRTGDYMGVPTMAAMITMTRLIERSMRTVESLGGGLIPGEEAITSRCSVQ